MKCNKNSWASCCRLVENSGWPRPTSALNICGAMPVWSPCKQSMNSMICQWWANIRQTAFSPSSESKSQACHGYQWKLRRCKSAVTDHFLLPWVQMHRFHLQGLVLVWNTLLTADRSRAWLCDKQTKPTSLHIQQYTRVAHRRRIWMAA